MIDEINLESHKGLLQTCQLSLSSSVFLVNLIDAGFRSILAVIWPHQEHFPVCYRYVLCNYRQWLHIILNFKKGSIKHCYIKYGLILKTIDLIWISLQTFCHDLYYSSPYKRRKRSLKGHQEIFDSENTMTLHSSIVFVKTHKSSVGFSLMTFLQLNGSTQRQQAELLLQLLA